MTSFRHSVLLEIMTVYINLLFIFKYFAGSVTKSSETRRNYLFSMNLLMIRYSSCQGYISPNSSRRDSDQRTSLRSIVIDSTVHSSFSWKTSEPLPFLATAFPPGKPCLFLKSRVLTSCDHEANTIAQDCSSNGKYLTFMLHMLL